MSEHRSTALELEAASYLIEQGWMKPCDQCREIESLVRGLNERSNFIRLSVDKVYPHDDTSPMEDLRVGGKLHWECQACKGTGVVPTKIGWQLIGMVKQFMENASGRNLAEIYEAPF